MPIKLAIFDLDGTLIDSVKVHSEAWSDSCKSFGYNIPESYFHDLTGMTSKSVGEKLIKDFRIPENVIDDLIQYKSKLYFDNINKIDVFENILEINGSAIFEVIWAVSLSTSSLLLPNFGADIRNSRSSS